MIVRMRLRKWDDAFTCQVPFAVKPGKCIGFLEVYDTEDDMRADYPVEQDYREIDVKAATRREEAP